jgi:tellurite methyltransferase
VKRAIVGFHQDDAGDSVAELSCLHAQHVRHQPPFRLAPWVLDDSERTARIGSMLDNPSCDRAELPEGLLVVRRTELWDEQTLPSALKRAHRVASGTWGRLCVEKVRLPFVAATEPALDVVVGPEAPQPIPPQVEHHVESPRPCALLRGVPPPVAERTRPSGPTAVLL